MEKRNETPRDSPPEGKDFIPPGRFSLLMSTKAKLLIALVALVLVYKFVLKE
ncbi:hypothetical protein HSR121_2570 [Halapricum desulfuricans]|uniref:Uncharacterized protein n=1 Tax=Halapricum desulfuricans TaxID=2841257 RepID=A0A897MXP3_9EURY|nr:hypothetical protein HSR121_2570 [Halapricum desulfuricans]